MLDGSSHELYIIFYLHQVARSNEWQNNENTMNLAIRNRRPSNVQNWYLETLIRLAMGSTLL